MRLYVRKGGKPTSITVSDLLCDLMAAKLALAYVNKRNAYATGKKLVQAWVNDLSASQAVPDRDVSQWVQANIIAAITDPEILKARDCLRRENEEAAARLRALREQKFGTGT